MQGRPRQYKIQFHERGVHPVLLQHLQCHGVVLRKIANTLRNSVYAQIQWAIGALGLQNKFRCTVSPMEITYLPTGQKILFFGLDQAGKAQIHQAAVWIHWHLVV